MRSKKHLPTFRHYVPMDRLCDPCQKRIVLLGGRQITASIQYITMFAPFNPHSNGKNFVVSIRFKNRELIAAAVRVFLAKDVTNMPKGKMASMEINKAIKVLCQTNQCCQ